MVLCNDQGEIIYDDEDYTGRLERGIESLRENGLLAPLPKPFTAEQLAEMRKFPAIVLDSMAGL